MRLSIALASVVIATSVGVAHASVSDDMKLCSGKAPAPTAKAVDACTTLIGKAAGNARRLSRLHLLRGNHYRDAGQLDRAAEDYSLAIRHDPQNKTALYNRGSLYHSLKRYQDAVDDFSRCLALAPRFHLARLERGMVLLAMKEYRRAIRDFNVGMGPVEMPYFLLLRGRAYIGAGLKNKAIADLRKALKNADAAITAPPGQVRKEARDELRRLGVAEK